MLQQLSERIALFPCACIVSAMNNAIVAALRAKALHLKDLGKSEHYDYMKAITVITSL
jgi:hypothetical protein